MPPSRVVLLFGARPNYMKVFPLWKAIRASAPAMRPLLVHTGQHYDFAMSDRFFADLGMPPPDLSLGVGSGTHAEQTARVMTALEPVLREQGADLLVVVGDVNSTVAGALTAVKLGIPVAHVEAGLRSRDRSMPEEINRVVTDAVSGLLFTSCRDADANLLREGADPAAIHFVGNIMIDSLLLCLPRAAASDVLDRLGLAPRGYAAVTLHRPSNVDRPERLAALLADLADVATGQGMPVVFPVHPRTRAQLDAAPAPRPPGLLLVEPLGYLDFLRLESEAALVITDSGGIQEETTFFGVPCLTVRENTERPVTLTEGTNRLVAPGERGAIAREAALSLGCGRRAAPSIEYWDGRTAGRIVDVLRAL